jgi:hypothetical protein
MTIAECDCCQKSSCWILRLQPAVMIAERFVSCVVNLTQVTKTVIVVIIAMTVVGGLLTRSIVVTSTGHYDYR